MSKSGLFAHFRSKDEVQIALLRHTAEVANQHVVAPAMRAAEGLPRLKALITNWLGWSTKAGLRGGCPVAAALFELDDAEGPVRDQVAEMETHWRGLLTQMVQGCRSARTSLPRSGRRSVRVGIVRHLLEPPRLTPIPSGRPIRSAGADRGRGPAATGSGDAEEKGSYGSQLKRLEN